MNQLPTPQPPRLRPRWLYRASYIWAGVGVGWLVVSGRLFSFFADFQRPVEHTAAPPELTSFLTVMLWFAFIGPLLWLAYDLGAQHTEARRLNTSVWRGLRETWRVAWQRPQLDDMASEFAETPSDDRVMALAQGILAASLPPAVFLGAVPFTRTTRGVIWIGVTGLIFGVTAYCRRRAAAYLVDDPGRWDLFRGWTLLDTDRYEPAGRRFVRVQAVCIPLLMIWWLSGAVWVLR